MKKTFKKGFTLIELLVVVAIIGILAAVVLANLNTARDKAGDAKIKAQLQTIHPTAILDYDDTGDYSNVCTAASAMVAAISATCDDEAEAFAAFATLSDGSTIWCVDSTGFTGEQSGTYAAATPACVN